MFWIITDIVFLVIGIILVVTSHYCNKFKYDDISEILICGAGCIFIAFFAASEFLRWGMT